MNLLNYFIVYKVERVLNREEFIMDLSEVYLRQIDEKLKHQIELQERQIEILAEIDKTNKNMENYVKSLNKTVG